MSEINQVFGEATNDNLSSLPLMRQTWRDALDQECCQIYRNTLTFDLSRLMVLEYIRDEICEGNLDAFYKSFINFREEMTFQPTFYNPVTDIDGLINFMRGHKGSAPVEAAFDRMFIKANVMGVPDKSLQYRKKQDHAFAQNTSAAITQFEQWRSTRDGLFIKDIVVQKIEEHRHNNAEGNECDITKMWSSIYIEKMVPVSSEAIRYNTDLVIANREKRVADLKRQTALDRSGLRLIVNK